MKKIFNLFLNQVTIVLAMVMVGTLAYSQCPAGMSEVSITYNGGAFNGENSWLLWDATAGAAVLCDDAPAVPGTFTACATEGNVLELYAYETFGDDWNGADISFASTEDGSANSCANSQVYVDMDDDPGGADGNGSLSTGVCANLTSPETGALVVGGVVLGCSGCMITCPDDIVVSNTEGLCAAVLECPLPTYDPAGCNLVSAFNILSLDNTANWADIPGFPNGGNSNPGLYSTDVSLEPICNFPLPFCVDELCLEVSIGGDLDFGAAEQVIVTSPQLPGFSFDSDLSGYVQCSEPVFEFCFDAAGWDAFRAACSIHLI